jgi:predicted transcriptional regulator
MKNEIIEILKQHIEVTPVQDIYTGLKVDGKDKLASAKVRGCLNSMVKKNTIKRISRGKYSL